MDVLVVSQARFGVKAVLDDVLPRLARSHDVDVTYLTISTNDGPEHCEKVSLLGRQGLELAERTKVTYLGYGVLEFWRRAHAYVRRAHERFDVVWYHNPRLLPLCPGTISGKLLVTYHSRLLATKANEATGFRRLYYRLVGQIEARGISDLTDARFTGVSPAVVEDIQRNGVPDNQVLPIGNGVDTETFYPPAESDNSKADWGFPVDRPVVLFVGRFAASKRPAAVIRVVARLQEQTPHDPMLVMAGDGPERELVERRIAEHGLTDVRLLGTVPRKRMPSLYRAADHFLLPTASDPGGPLALYEALASGVPCVVSAESSADFVEEHGGGSVVDFGSPSDVAEALSQQMEANSAMFRENARKYAVEHLDWRDVIEAYHEQLSGISATTGD